MEPAAPGKKVKRVKGERAEQQIEEIRGSLQRAQRGIAATKD
jgi:hypothetical protein